MTPVLYLVLAYSLAASALGQTYCSLVIRVVDYNDREINADIKVTEKNGRLTQQENEAGGARFCNLGIQPVTVTVGGRVVE